eukprot:4482061-Prymnesium_polylepis.1
MNWHVPANLQWRGLERSWRWSAVTRRAAWAVCRASSRAHGRTMPKQASRTGGAASSHRESAAAPPAHKSRHAVAE